MTNPRMTPMLPTASRKHSPVPSSGYASLIATSLALLVSSGALSAATPTERETATPVTAVTAETIMMDAFKVNSVRGALISAQEMKQNNLQFTDSIVAQDVGKLPDNSVADALQRIPGIQVGRSSGEVDLVLIRGLPNFATTLNSEEIFTGTGRGIALQDIPSELVAGVDVYKSNVPDQVEGGIAGLIDIRLRRPLDLKDLEIAGSLTARYGENADKTGLVGSVLASKRWKTADGGEIGALYAYSYQKHYAIDQTVFNFLFEPVGTTVVAGQTTLQLPFTQGSLIIPNDRERQAHSASVQWKPNSNLELYTDFLKTVYRDERQVHFNIGFPRFGGFTAATVHPGTNIPITLNTENNFHLTSTQAFRDKTDGYQSVVGLKWNSGAIKSNAEFIYNWNSVKHRVMIIDTRFAPPAPARYVWTFNDGDGRANQLITGQDITNGNNYFLWGLFDNRDYSTSEQKALKADLEYSMGPGFFTSIKGGIRVSERDAKFRGTTRNDIAPAGATGGDRFAPTVPRTSTIPGFGSINPAGPLDYYSTPHWFGASPDFLYNQAGTIRTLFGLPVTDADFNPTIAFTDTEKTYAGYVQAKYSAKPGELPLDGLVGVRVVKTKQSLTGYRANGTPIDDSEDQTDVLPTLNGRLKLQNDLLFRFSYGRAITRPDFAALNPAATLNAPTTTGGAAGTGSGGNPDLKSVKSDNFDVGLEYYFAKGSYVSLSAFHRKIDGYVQTFATLETIGGVNYVVTRPRNSGEGELQGLEASYQHFPDFLPSFLTGLGWHTNVTYITGDTDSEDPTSTANPRTRTRLDYPQVSKWAYNIIGIYERGPFSARLAYNWRGEFVDTFNGPNQPPSALRTIKSKRTDQLDFSASYRFNDHLIVELGLTNILDSVEQDYFNDPRFVRDTRAMDRTASIGVRYRY